MWFSLLPGESKNRTFYGSVPDPFFHSKIKGKGRQCETNFQNRFQGHLNHTRTTPIFAKPRPFKSNCVMPELKIRISDIYVPVDFQQWFTAGSFMPGHNNKFDWSESNFVRNLSDDRLLFSALHACHNLCC